MTQFYIIRLCLLEHSADNNQWSICVVYKIKIKRKLIIGPVKIIQMTPSPRDLAYITWRQQLRHTFHAENS